MTDGKPSDDCWLCRDFGSWSHFACLIVGLAGGYIGRPLLDLAAAAAKLWWEYNTRGLP